METPPSLLDVMRDAEVERVRFKRDGRATRVLAARSDQGWEPAVNLLSGQDALISETAAAFKKGGHERLDLVFRPDIGMRFLCAVHSTHLGPGAGGLRRHDLGVPEKEVIQDLLNLSRAMTYKNAFAETGRGGSKLCLHNPPLPPYDREAWLLALTEEIDLSGTITGPDTGLTPQDMKELAERTGNVSGVRGGGTSASAALGVHEAVRATAAALGRALNETHVAVHGLGSVGGALATLLAGDGCRLTVTDRDHRKIDAFLSELTPQDRRRCGVVAPYQILDVAADILSPCAIGGILSEEAVARLECRAVCGGANNQIRGDSLEEELAVARRLQERGVLFVPDWMASAGGTIHGTMESRLADAFDLRKVQARVRRACGWLVDELLEEAKRAGRPPLEIAVERHLSATGLQVPAR